MTALANHTIRTVPRRPVDSVMCDGLLRQAAGPRFRFSESNPAGTGRTYAQSRFAELPYLVGVLVHRDLGLSEVEWDDLVAVGAVLALTGPGEYRVPFTLDVIASPARPGRTGPARSVRRLLGHRLRDRQRRNDDWGRGRAVRLLLRRSVDMTTPDDTETGTDRAAVLADQAISARLSDPDYRWWRGQVEATRGCAAPIHLHGSSRVLDRDGATLLERSGTVLAPCGTAARACARPARTATAPMRSTSCAPASRATRARASPPPWSSTRGRSSP